MKHQSAEYQISAKNCYCLHGSHNHLKSCNWWRYISCHCQRSHQKLIWKNIITISCFHIPWCQCSWKYTVATQKVKNLLSGCKFSHSFTRIFN